MNDRQTVHARTGVGSAGRVVRRGLEGRAFPRRVTFGNAGGVLRIVVGPRIVPLENSLDDPEPIIRVACLV